MKPEREQALADPTAEADSHPSTGELAFAETAITGVPIVTADTVLASAPGSDRRVEAGVAPQVGSVIKHYELIRKLGQGGMGMVFLARDTRLGRLVAIKFLLDHQGDHAERFLAEARATAHCKHENIVVIYEVDEVCGYPYMVLEYIQGPTLRAAMDQRMGHDGSQALLPGAGPVPPSLAVELMVPVVRALDCAHRLGIVHRDLKPENILLSDSGPIKVVDFGIAKRISAEAIPAAKGALHPAGAFVGLTQQGMLVGTLPYMSPEQWRAEKVTPCSDIWAVGIMLYELVTGAHPLAPFSMNRLSDVADLAPSMPSVREKRSDLGALGAVIDRCLKKRSSERIGSAGELLAELLPLLPGRQVLELSRDENPFAGLAAFQEQDTARFFGRDRDIVSMVGRLRNHPLVAVAGPSGAGKSSFVRAGVIPALKRAGEGWEAFVLRPGLRPLVALADVLAQLPEPAMDHAGFGAEGALVATRSPIVQLGVSVPEAEDHDALVAMLRSRPGVLGARLRARCRRGGPGRRVVLFVDQFEELYTLGIDAEERAQFVACLDGVADDASSPARVVLALRSDFLDRVAEDRHLMAEVTRGLVFLAPMGRDGLREALTRPVEAAGHRFETEQMVEHMLDTLEAARSPLPLLQFTAAKLWEARDREQRLLTRGSYERLGGVVGALSTHADAVIGGLPPPEQRLARAVLLRLVTPERTRAVVSMAELCELAQASGGDAGGGTGAAAVEQVVQHLAGARLLLIEPGSEREGSTVELVHESLIERWTKLRQWLDESEQDAQFLARLRAAAQQWEASGRAEGLLWRDRAARDAQQWLDRRRGEQGKDVPSGLAQREERYLMAVVALAEGARRLRRRLAIAVITGLTAIAVVVSYLALRAGREAARARSEAVRADGEAVRAQAEAVQARNATRMAAARELQTDPTTVLALLREIEPPDVPRGWSELGRWALYSGVATHVFTHPDVVTCSAFSRDGKRLVTTSFDKAARVWNADGTGEPVLLRGHEDRVWSAAFSPDGTRVVTASNDRTARVWNADGTGEPLIFRGHQASVNTAAFSPDGKRILTASDDETVGVWNAGGTGEPLWIRGHLGRVWSAAWSPDGKRIVIAAASKDLAARVWNADGTGEPLVLRGHEDVVTSAAFSPDGKHIVTTSDDKTARIWNADGTGEPLVLRGHQDGIYSAAFSADGKRIVTASNDKTARVWNADGTGELSVLRGHQDMLLSAAFSPDGRRIVTAGYDKTARVWNARSTGEPLVLRGHQHQVLSAAFNPDGSRIVTTSNDETARVWNANGTGEPLVLRAKLGRVWSAAFSPDGTRIVIASGATTASIWNADAAGKPLLFPGHRDGILSAAFSPDGRRIVTASGDTMVRVWNADGTGEPLVLPGHEQGVNAAVFSPDGTRIVSASDDKTARVWNADGTGEPFVLRGHEDAVNSAAFSPDAQRIVTASWDKTARVWNALAMGEPLVLRGHEHGLSSAQFSPDGRRIVTASQDKTVRVWNADGTGEPLVLRGSDGAYNRAAFSPDGKRIAAASDDKAAWVWSDLAPLLGTRDPRLWKATAYCMPIERRVAVLNMPEATARTHLQACLHRVEEAREAASEQD